MQISRRSVGRVNRTPSFELEDKRLLTKTRFDAVSVLVGLLATLSED